MPHVDEVAFAGLLGRRHHARRAMIGHLVGAGAIAVIGIVATLSILGSDLDPSSEAFPLVVTVAACVVACVVVPRGAHSTRDRRER